MENWLVVQLFPKRMTWERKPLKREAGPLLAAAMVPGLGGREALLSDTWDMVTVLEVFFDTSIPLCASEMCSSLSSSGLGESKISGLEREEDVSD